MGLELSSVVAKRPKITFAFEVTNIIHRRWEETQRTQAFEELWFYKAGN